MLLVLHRKGRVSQIIQGGEVHDGCVWQNGHKITSGLGGEWAYVPNQPLNYEEHDGQIVIAMNYPGDFVLFSLQELGQIVDLDTGKAINQAVHPFAGTDESIGTIREMVVQIINAIGLEPTADFARLNDIAIAAIKEAAVKKAKL